jgi:hypothetical protein
VGDDVRAVAPSERDLIALARALISSPGASPGGPGRSASPEVQAMLSGTRAMYPVISVACEALLGDALAQVWPALWRRGGAQPSASLDGGAVRRGRIWERHAPIGLAFSPATVRLLRWLIATPLTGASTPRASTPWPQPGLPGRETGWLEETALTVGDQVMIYLALDAATGTPAQAAIAAQPLIRAAPLAWLGFADRLGAPPSLAFDSLCVGAGAIVVEALTKELAQRWRAVELSKRSITAPERLIALGAAQDATLRGFMAACDRHRRRDLAGFVIDAAAPLLQREIVPTPARLDPGAPLARRAAARVAAGALLRAVTVWAAWDQAHRGVRFIDDDYPAAQLLLARFEALQTSGAGRAAGWLAELASLAPTAAGSAATVDPP